MNNDQDKPAVRVKVSPEDIREDTKYNLLNILFYSLALAIALGFNDVVTTIFDSFYQSKQIISKVTYLIILIGLTISVAVYSGSRIQNI